MSVRSRFIRLLKRIDNTQFNFTPQPQGIRYLTDEGGHVLALLVTQIDPNQAEPLVPPAITAAKGDAVTIGENAFIVSGRRHSYNETNFDVVRNNLRKTFYASAARTASAVGTLQTNYNGKGVLITTNVTAVSGTSPTLRVDVIVVDDTAGNAGQTYLSSRSIAATGRFIFVCYPGSQGAVGGSATLPANVDAGALAVNRDYRIDLVIGGTTPSFTSSSIGGEIV